jgi:hypothetical protein
LPTPSKAGLSSILFVATYPMALEAEAVPACITTFVRVDAVAKAFAPYRAAPAPAVAPPTIPLTTT